MSRRTTDDPAGPVPGPEIRGAGIPRREFLRSLAVAGAGLAVAPFVSACEARTGPADLFPDGVMCGDPQPDGAVIWTRVGPPRDGRRRPLLWLVSDDLAGHRVVRGGLVFTDPAASHTARIRVRGLRPDRWYSYRFAGPGGFGPVGRLRTAPAPGAMPDHLCYVAAGDQQRGNRGVDGRESLYVAHRAIARENPDFVLHLGDYVYVDDFGTLALDDYRGVYRTFRTNPLLQEMQAAAPLVAVWDDGEFYNGVDRTGPPERLAAAKRAWFEAMPIEWNPEDRIHRAFGWGRLADVIVTDLRSYRDPEVPANASLGFLDGEDACLPSGQAMFAPDRTTLGVAQRTWLEGRLRDSSAAWRLIGSSVNVTPWKLVDRAACAGATPFPINAGLYASNDGWDDYAAERRRLLEFLLRERIDNVVFNSAQAHYFVASELQPDFDDAASPTAGFDFSTGSLTADPDPLSLAPEPLLRAAETFIRSANVPYMKHLDLVAQGYLRVDVTPEECVVRFRAVDSFDPAAEATTVARFRIAAGSRTLEVLAPDP